MKYITLLLILFLLSCKQEYKTKSAIWVTGGKWNESCLLDSLSEFTLLKHYRNDLYLIQTHQHGRGSLCGIEWKALIKKEDLLNKCIRIDTCQYYKDRQYLKHDR